MRYRSALSSGGNAMADARPFDPALFADAAIDVETAKLNSDMIQMLTGQPEWWIVGAEAARAARRRGEGPFPAPVFSDRARILPSPARTARNNFARHLTCAISTRDLFAFTRRRLGAGRR